MIAATHQPLLRVRGLTKTFPGLRALDGVDLEVGAGEVVAVVGANGSGKSTLVKILAGVYEADGGSIETLRREGTEVGGRAARSELHFIHQDLGLIPMLTTIENLDLGRELGSGGLRPVHTRREASRARELIAQFGVRFDVRAPVLQLSAAERTIVAIARALDGWTRDDNVLVLDEPTAALHGDEAGKLFEAIRRVAQRGAAVIFISHRLDEVMDLAHRVVVLRDGKKVADVAAGEFDHDALVRMIVGRAVAEGVSRQGRTDDVLLRVSGLRGSTVKGVDFTLRAGEILGVTGILGSGREHLSRVLFGALPRSGGEVLLEGRALPPASPSRAISRDIGFVPADRHRDGAVMTLSVRENLTLPRLAPFRRRLGQIDGRAERREAREWVDRVQLRPPSSERALGLFSGGNQQKVVLAKWLRNDPTLLLLDEPTQGVDVGAKAAIYELLARAAANGTGVLVSSSDTKELAMLCDRVLVLRDGELVAEIEGSQLSEDRMIRESLGLAPELLQRVSGAGGKETHD
ncbi:MAG: sugar ABC transporter ATP-binding protein [Solirubrobacteraceae bacterium]